ncbi:hypothetical protein TVAG_138920 [Trichomonas vaginalis G3]|uniref:Sel1 repeat family protein n=1 Tax=Trichomonas vaginalis (strain ATCC PRA-98 / G3) TaxID=412133 RepID=A2E467_TRIV3|nr:tetratricopeptide repeat domain domain-containing protein [Trichomonas vaginalis G3]EAY12513.1 hypothetical protein TVAG_138920 [Trichomonas vaginalis G3]KAI5554050.1 tetratricopeptide repeat domain domain-containing protein [Trichomonas vaginalis G3]|eukprot:XP_001324736.1 hypothetical protein [Trichomonas vaginalis G3]
MLVTPSPLLVVHHKHQNFDDQLYHLEYALANNASDINNSPKSQLFTDLAFLCLNEDNQNAKKSSLRASIFLSLLTDLESPDIPLFLGILALSTNDSYTARHWLQKSASLGNKNAMVLLGRLTMGAFNTAPLPDFDDRPILTAIRWFIRAIRSGSVVANYYLGELYFQHNDYRRALIYFNTYFAKTKSVLAAGFIAVSLQNLGQTQLSIKWHRWCASQGLQASANSLLVIYRSGNYVVSFFQWLSVATRYSFLKEKKYFFSPLLKATLTDKIEFPQLSAAISLLSFSEPYKQASQFLPAQPSVEFRPILNESEIVAVSKSDNPGLCPATRLPSIPATTPTQLLLKAFDLANPYFEKRNLAMCKSILQHLQNLKPRGICESHLFRAKCKSQSANDLCTAALIALVLEDAAYALELFGKAAILGSETANLFIGLILFHGLVNTERTESGVIYLSRCPLEPVALLHLAVIYNDKVWARRAAQSLGSTEESGEMHEYVGDLFANGIKFPKDGKVAMMWYGIALQKYEEFGLDTNNILQKMAQHAYNSRSSFK